MYPEVVYEDESRSEYILHDHYKRNGGRGLSDEQVNAFKEALIIEGYQLMMSRI